MFKNIIIVTSVAAVGYIILKKIATDMIVNMYQEAANQAVHDFQTQGFTEFVSKHMNDNN